ncbi:MAG: glutathione peroxidase [Frankiaceae bacterium]|nr:glutathione peroxidase [Frankiaceae bacterium]
MSLHDIKVETITGEITTLGEYGGKALLIVNVASKCGLTPQYTGLEALQEELGPRGFTVLGFPCNQFRGQEPGTAEEIQEFCSTTYGVTFPLFAKIDVNGDERHPLYTELTAFPADDDKGRDVVWNFEKFLVSPAGEVVGRFRPTVTPEDPALRAAIEAQLPA